MISCFLYLLLYILSGFDKVILIFTNKRIMIPLFSVVLYKATMNQFFIILDFNSVCEIKYFNAITNC